MEGELLMSQEQTGASSSQHLPNSSGLTFSSRQLIRMRWLEKLHLTHDREHSILTRNKRIDNLLESIRPDRVRVGLLAAVKWSTSDETG